MVLEGMGLAMLPIYDTKKFMISEREGRGPGWWGLGILDEVSGVASV